jgi:hypothetical protein
LTKKRKADLDGDPLDREIDFSKMRRVPNPFAGEFYKFRNVVILSPDVLEHFPDSRAVNAALRKLIAQKAKTVKRSVKTASAPRTKTK